MAQKDKQLTGNGSEGTNDLPAMIQKNNRFTGKWFRGDKQITGNGPEGIKN